MSIPSGQPPVPGSASPSCPTGSPPATTRPGCRRSATGSGPATSRGSSTGGCPGIPVPLTTDDQAAGYWWELSMRQVEVSRTMVFDAPARPGRSSRRWSPTTSTSAGPSTSSCSSSGNPRGRKPKDQAGGVFKTAIDRNNQGVTINAFWRHSRLKQYLKDGRALRIETVVNSPDDLGCQRRLHNLQQAPGPGACDQHPAAAD